MFIREIIVEDIDKESKYVLKKVITNEGSFLGRQMPVTNSLYNIEKKRKLMKKQLLKTPFQTYHVHLDNDSWNFNKKFYAVKQHAKEESRIFIPYMQRNQEKLIELDWKIAEDDFMELLNTGSQYVTYNIPENGSLEEWQKRLADAESQLRGNQQIIPVLSSNHNPNSFGYFIRNLIGRFHFVGVHFMSPKSHANSRVNLLDLWNVNANIEKGNRTSVIIGFNNKSHYEKNKVSGSFVCAKHGIDVPSQIQLSPTQIKGMMSTKEEEVEADDAYIYDMLEGGFNKAKEQIAWYGQNRTLVLLENISLAEGLIPYQAILWSSFNGQQQDFNNLNMAILEKDGISKLIEEKSRWHTYLITEIN